MEFKTNYVLDNIKTAEYGSDFDLVMLLFGEFNVFSPEDAAKILEKSFNALKPGGILLIEPLPQPAAPGVRICTVRAITLGGTVLYGGERGGIVHHVLADCLGVVSA